MSIDYWNFTISTANQYCCLAKLRTEFEERLSLILPKLGCVKSFPILVSGSRHLRARLTRSWIQFTSHFSLHFNLLPARSSSSILQCNIFSAEWNWKDSCMIQRFKYLSSEKKYNSWHNTKVVQNCITEHLCLLKN